MSVPRGLTAEEAAAWSKLAESVTPMAGRRKPPAASPSGSPPTPGPVRVSRAPAATPRREPAPPAPPRRPPLAEAGLDSHWDRRLKAGLAQPDFTLDLHGLGLDGAYNRLMSGVSQARAMNARTVLLVTGKSRPVDPADRGTRRGAIRAKVLDWLAASSHADAIAAVRKAHRHHGGDGALYIVLRRER